MMSNKMRPVHPGEILKDELIELGLSANAMAKDLGVPTNRITAILNEQSTNLPGKAGPPETFFLATFLLAFKRLLA